MNDVTKQEVKVHGTNGTMTVLFYERDLAALRSMGVRVGDMVIHRSPSSKEFKSPEIPWKVKGERRNIPVSHLLHDIVGQNKRVRYKSDDARVMEAQFDLRPDTHELYGTGKPRGKKPKAKIMKAPAEDKILGHFETQEEVAAAFHTARALEPESDFEIEEEKVTVYRLVRRA